MLDLMVVRGKEMPLYMHVVNRVLREMRIEQQKTGSAFSYRNFKQRMEDEDLTSQQSSPFKQRLDTLESFMPRPVVNAKGKRLKPRGNDWTPKVPRSTG